MPYAARARRRRPTACFNARTRRHDERNRFRPLLAIAGDLANRVAIVDPLAERVDWTVGVGRHPAALAFSDDGKASYDALPAQIDLDEKNPRTAYRAADSARLDFAHADCADDGELNDILWHAVKGAHATPPPYGLFR